MDDDADNTVPIATEVAQPDGTDEAIAEAKRDAEAAEKEAAEKAAAEQESLKPKKGKTSNG